MGTSSILWITTKSAASFPYYNFFSIPLVGPERAVSAAVKIFKAAFNLANLLSITSIWLGWMSLWSAGLALTLHDELFWVSWLPQREHCTQTAAAGHTGPAAHCSHLKSNTAGGPSHLYSSNQWPALLTGDTRWVKPDRWERATALRVCVCVGRTEGGRWTSELVRFTLTPTMACLVTHLMDCEGRKRACVYVCMGGAIDSRMPRVTVLLFLSSFPHSHPQLPQWCTAFIQLEPPHFWVAAELISASAQKPSCGCVSTNLPGNRCGSIMPREHMNGESAREE